MEPIAVLLAPIVFDANERYPKDAFKFADVFAFSDSKPKAEFRLPVVFEYRAFEPTAILAIACVESGTPTPLFRSAESPIAMMLWRSELLKSALAPMAILLYPVLLRPLW